MTIRHLVLSLVLGAAPAFASAAGTIPLTVSQELVKLYTEDQADRDGPPNAQRDWNAISLRDEQRELRVKELLAAGPLGSGESYYHAADRPPAAFRYPVAVPLQPPAKASAG